MQQYEKFLPTGFHKLSIAEKRAARDRAYIDWQAWKAERKVALVAEKAAKVATQMTCQVCGRGIFAETGFIAHHGYTRPYEGVQTASCRGARVLPFEASRDALEKEIEAVEEIATKLRAHIARLQAEETHILYAWETRERQPYARRGFKEEHSKVTRENFNEVIAVIKANGRWSPMNLGLHSFDGMLKNEVRKMQFRLEGIERYLAEQKQRFDGWKPTYRLGAGSEPVWVAL
jgi:hypothetical protein